VHTADRPTLTTVYKHRLLQGDPIGVIIAQCDSYVLKEAILVGTFRVFVIPQKDLHDLLFCRGPTSLGFNALLISCVIKDILRLESNAQILLERLLMIKQPKVKICQG